MPAPTARSMVISASSITGAWIKHTMGPVSLKLYDKFSLILRIETTVNDLTFFRHYREVEHRDGTKETKWAAMQKTICQPHWFFHSSKLFSASPRSR